MANDFLSVFVGDPARAKILRVFLFNQPDILTAGLVAKRAGISLSVAQREISVLEHWGVVKPVKIAITVSNNKKVEGKQKEPAWTINQSFEYITALNKFVHEISPMQHGNIVDALKKSGKLSAVILSGMFVGDPSRPADLIVAGDPINEQRLDQAIRSLEPQLGREIRYAMFSLPEFRYRLTIQDRLIRETLDYPHLVLIDKADLF